MFYYYNYSPQRQPQPCAFHILNLLPFWKGKGLTLTFRFWKELKKHQFGQIHFSCKTNIANYSWCTCSKTSLIQLSGGPKPAEMVPPTDMEKQQVATEARKHVQDIKKKHNKKIYFADLYWFNKWSFSSVSRCVPWLMLITSAQACSLTSALISAAMMRSANKPSFISWKWNRSTQRSRKGLTIGRNVSESPFYVE